MWIFLSDSFLSVVSHRTKPEVLLVRARVKGDIERVFPKAKVTRSPSADYLFRAEMTRAAVAKAMTERIRRIDYDNFKNSIREDDRHDACSKIWQVMYSLQATRDTGQ
jgi:hypothetical protein